jgi:hypothetical protein
MRILGAFGAPLAALALASASFAAPAGTAAPFLGQGLRERLRADGRVRVLVSREAPPAGRDTLPGGLDVVRSLSGGRLLAGWLTPEGLDRLRADRSTRAVVLDRVVRPAGQVGVAQIGADRLQTAGLTGAGRAIGIIDTGIDLYHPDLGAGADGSSRVIGGWNFADGDSEVFDCNGHGTAVAGVAAGGQGIAPEASIVALKVFGARDGCGAALASDVLSAVDWAVGRRYDLRIDVLNLSLADERVRAGFCDAEDPVSAEAFARARAAGLVVVAASGNTGHPGGLSWPACHSDVVSVGMVYSLGVGPVEWNEEADCRDAITGPDLVPCASNSGEALSLLAPGVKWLVPTAGGGRRTSFSGTSAAAPAAAGSLLLARQVRPYRDPLLSVDFLRLTGVPVVDDRSGRISPRVDVGAAFSSTSPFTGPCASEPGSEDLSGAIVCRTETSALLGTVSSLTVSLSLEHPDLSRVRATLTGPDGITVRMFGGVARAGTVLREVVGRTLESEEPLSLFAGHPAAGEWVLRLEDGSTSVGGRLTSWALLIEPAAPRPGGLPGAMTTLLPTVAKTAGRHGAFFSTDVVLFNADEMVPANVSLAFYPAAHPDGEPVTVSLSLPPLSTRTLSDVVGNAFRSSGFGPVHVSAPESVVLASRTNSTGAGGGSYGLLAPGVSPDRSIGAGEPPVYLAPVFRPSSSRLNAGFVETAGASASVEVLIRDGSGTVKGRFDVELEALGSRQVSDVQAAAAVGADAGDLLEVHVRGGSGRVVAWATAVDNGSNDGLLVVGSKARRDAYLPAATRSPGLYGAFFRTDLKLSNPSHSPINVRISHFPSKGTVLYPLVVSLGAYETRVFEDVLASLLGATADSAGALRVTVLGDAPGIVASSRTYTEEPGRSYGLAIGLLNDAEAVANERIALTFLSSSPDARTNLGFLETFGLPTLVKVTLYDNAGGALASRELALGRYQAVQWNDVFAETGAPPRESASAIVEVLSGGAVIAHAIRVDNRTNDASFMEGRVLRKPLALSRTDR